MQCLAPSVPIASQRSTARFLWRAISVSAGSRLLCTVMVFDYEIAPAYEYRHKFVFVHVLFSFDPQPLRRVVGIGGSNRANSGAADTR